MAAVLAAAVAGTVACPGEGGPGGGVRQQAAVDSTVNEPPYTGTFASVSDSNLLAFAQTEEFDTTTKWLTDERRLTVVRRDAAGQVVLDTGPIAKIGPNRKLQWIDSSHFERAPRPVAVIDSRGAYPKLALQPGRNFLFLEREAPAGTWRARMLPAGQELTVVRDSHPGVMIPPAARFIFDPNDETAWVRCANGCCTVRVLGTSPG